MPCTVVCSTGIGGGKLTGGSAVLYADGDATETQVSGGVISARPTKFGAYQFTGPVDGSNNPLTGLYYFELKNTAGAVLSFGWVWLEASGEVQACADRTMASFQHYNPALIANLSAITVAGLTTDGIVALRSALAGMPIKSVGLADELDGITLQIVQGDDYSVADGTPISFPCPNTALTGWTPVLAISCNDIVLTLTAAVIADTSLPLQFEATATDSSSLPAGIPGTFALRFTRAGRTHTTSIRGNVDVAARIG